MPRRRKAKIREKDLQGFKHFKQFLPVLERLHDDACERDRAHNRELHFDQHVAIMACLLIALWTGGKPTLRTYEMLCFYFIGLADEDELLGHVAKLQSQS